MIAARRVVTALNFLGVVTHPLALLAIRKMCSTCARMCEGSPMLLLPLVRKALRREEKFRAMDAELCDDLEAPPSKPRNLIHLVVLSLFVVLVGAEAKSCVSVKIKSIENMWRTNCCAQIPVPWRQSQGRPHPFL